MKILVIGSGAREHALCWKLKQSTHAGEIFCAPGNAGIAREFCCVPVGARHGVPLHYNEILKWTKNNNIDLVVIGPEAPLADGLSDIFAENKIRCFGPNKSAARLEASKIFAKDFMNKFGIPTAKHVNFDFLSVCRDAINRVCASFNFPVVVKADGLAAGKGVVIANNKSEMGDVINKIMNEGSWGSSGRKIVIEEFLPGQEVSLLCFADGKTILSMVGARDHKKIYDDDKGPNTGGMGAYAPDYFLSENDKNLIYDKIIEPTLYGLRRSSIDYKGVLYFGLMMTDNGPYVLEYNARFGDPETQCLLPLLETDLVEVMLACVEGGLGNINLKWENKTALSIVVASKGYPGEYEKDVPLPDLSCLDKDILVFYAGVSTPGVAEKNKTLVSSGGRVLNIVAVSDDINKAREKVYGNLNKTDFSKFHYRKDIGEGVLRSSGPRTL